MNLSETHEHVKQPKNDPKEICAYLRQEIGFQKLLHPMDAKERPHLYKMNYLTCEKLVENITILIDSTIEETGEVVLLPNEDDIMEILKIKSQEPTMVPRFIQQQTLAILWNNDNGSSYWSIGFHVCDEEAERIKVDHSELKPGHKDDKTKWIRPLHDDIQVVNPVQILPCDIDGEWDFSSHRQPVYVINNSLFIDFIYSSSIYKNILQFNIL